MNEKKKVGRKPRPILYTDVKYNDKDYVVGIITSNKGFIKFVFDKEDEENVKGKSWHVTSTGYISSYYVYNNATVQLLLHNVVMSRMIFPGKGAKESVDHINRNPLDNRKENLRIISQTEQNLNQKKKTRTLVKLPDDSGISPDELPRHIWYVKANGAHGDRFAIEFKTEGIIWKSTSSKQVSLREKLNQAKYKLSELYIEYPYLNPITNTILETADNLNKSFNKIVQTSENTLL